MRSASNTAARARPTPGRWLLRHSPAARRRAWLALSLLGVVLLALPAQAYAQCAMCRTALNSPEGRALIAAFQRGIFLLLAVPFGLILGIAALAVRSQRRLLREADGSPREAERRGTSSSAARPLARPIHPAPPA